MILCLVQFGNIGGTEITNADTNCVFDSNAAGEEFFICQALAPSFFPTTHDPSVPWAVDKSVSCQESRIMLKLLPEDHT